MKNIKDTDTTKQKQKGRDHFQKDDLSPGEETRTDERRVLLRRRRHRTQPGPAARRGESNAQSDEMITSGGGERAEGGLGHPAGDEGGKEKSWRGGAARSSGDGGMDKERAAATGGHPGWLL